MLALFAAAGLALAYLLADTLLLVFAGILLAVVLDVSALALRRLLPLGHLARLSIVTTLACLILGAAAAWGGLRLLTQAHNLIDLITQQALHMSEQLKALGFPLSDEGNADGDASLKDYLPDPGQLFGHAQSTFSAATGALTNIVIILFLAIFFAANPSGYRDGFLRLLPVRHRTRVYGASIRMRRERQSR